MMIAYMKTSIKQPLKMRNKANYSLHEGISKIPGKPPTIRHRMVYPLCHRHEITPTEGGGGNGGKTKPFMKS